MFGLIIIGTKPVRQKIGTGTFACPVCRGNTACVRYKVRQYFTLFFIPLFPLGPWKETVRCGRCGSDFSADMPGSGGVVSYEAPATWQCSRCGNMNPPEYERCVACGQVK